VNQDPVIESRLTDLISQLTLAEKIGLLPTSQGAIPRLGIPEFWVGGEAAHGLVARDGTTTVFPQTLGLSSTWDPDLLERVGTVTGEEARVYSEHRAGLTGLCLWAPTVDLERDPRWGRTEEGYGEDPILTGCLASAYVRGLQGNHPRYLRTAATLKHFYANNHENGRTSTSSEVPPDLADEYYLKAFELVLRDGGALSVMTAYNAVNGTPAMVHQDIQKVLRDRWGWDGFVVCDGGALTLLVSDHKAFADWPEAVAASLKAGIDCFPEPAVPLIAAATEALARGLITEADVDRAVSRTLRVRLRLGLLAPEGENPYTPASRSLLHRTTSRTLAREAATKAVVLVKNDGLLPLADQTIAAVGPLAEAAYRDWYGGTPLSTVTPLQALVERLGAGRVLAADGCDLVSLKASDGGYVGVAGWDDPGLVANRGSAQPGDLYRRTDWGVQTFQALSNGQFLTTDDRTVTAGSAEVGGWFVREKFGAAAAGPGPLVSWKGDEVGIDGGERLAIAGREGVRSSQFTVDVVREGLAGVVGAARHAATTVVFVGNHPLLNGRETEDRPGLTLAPAQVTLIRTAARANPRTVVVIVGSYPFAIGEWQDEVRAVLWTAHGGQEAGRALTALLFGDATPSGRLSMTWYRSEADLPPITDYDIRTRGRTHLYFAGTPLYPFGHGLSYTTFRYEALGWNPADGRAEVTVTNTGSRAGDEVIQFYQERRLVGFVRVSLAAGERKAVRCPLNGLLTPGPAPLAVGSSSLDLRLTLSLEGLL